MGGCRGSDLEMGSRRRLSSLVLGFPWEMYVGGYNTIHLVGLKIPFVKGKS